ncbi:MAG: hypothetical protein ACPGQL_09980 [Thermoplasmatota archaeon]
MAGPLAPDDARGSPWQQSLVVDRSPKEAIDAAQTYLEGAGVIATRLAGRVERDGDRLAVHHGRIRTRIEATAASGRPGASHVQVDRAGAAPLEETRSWLVLLGLVGTVLGWGLAFYNDRNSTFLPPLVTIAVFFAAILAAVTLLYVVDRSLERRSSSLMLSLEDAMRGDPLLVLRREVAALDKQLALVNGLLFYAVALVVEFIVFVALLDNGIDDAVTLEVMRWGFTLPLVPALLFAGGYYAWSQRLHDRRHEALERRAQAAATAPPTA